MLVNRSQIKLVRTDLHKAARGGKYIQRKPDGKGGYHYIYTHSGGDSPVHGKKKINVTQHHDKKNPDHQADHRDHKQNYLLHEEAQKLSAKANRTNKLKDHEVAEKAHDNLRQRLDELADGYGEDMDSANGNKKEEARAENQVSAAMNLANHHEEMADKHSEAGYAIKPGRGEARFGGAQKTKKAVLVTSLDTSLHKAVSRGGKYISKKPDGKGGFRYIYTHPDTKKKIDTSKHHDKKDRSHMEDIAEHETNLKRHGTSMEASAKAHKSGKFADHAKAEKLHDKLANRFDSLADMYNDNADFHDDNPKERKRAETNRDAMQALANHHEDMSQHHDKSEEKYQAKLKKEGKKDTRPAWMKPKPKRK